MTESDIIRLAEQAGINYRKNTEEFYSDFCDGICINDLGKFATLIATEIMPKETLAAMFEWGKDAGRNEEREACAVIAFNAKTYLEAAAAIRARGQSFQSK